MTVHCPTCTCQSATEVEEPCPDTLRLGHERFTCNGLVDHHGLHNYTMVNDPCTGCGGYEEHSERCPMMERVLDPSKSDVTIEWDDDGAHSFRAVP